MIHQHEEPYEGRLSRTVLWEDWGEIPLSDPISCNPKEQTTVQKLTNRQTTKKPTRKMAHLVFPDTRANAQKTKRAIFLPTL